MMHLPTILNPTILLLLLGLPAGIVALVVLAVSLVVKRRNANWADAQELEESPRTEAETAALEQYAAPQMTYSEAMDAAMKDAEAIVVASTPKPSVEKPVPPRAVKNPDAIPLPRAVEMARHLAGHAVASVATFEGNLDVGNPPPPEGASTLDMQNIYGPCEVCGVSGRHGHTIEEVRRYVTNLVLQRYRHYVQKTNLDVLSDEDVARLYERCRVRLENSGHFAAAADEAFYQQVKAEAAKEQDAEVEKLKRALADYGYTVTKRPEKSKKARRRK